MGMIHLAIIISYIVAYSCILLLCIVLTGKLTSWKGNQVSRTTAAHNIIIAVFNQNTRDKDHTASFTIISHVCTHIL